MRKLTGLILIVVLLFLLTGAAGFDAHNMNPQSEVPGGGGGGGGAAGFDAANMNPQSQVHSAHIGPGTVGLNCDTCHGFPPNAIQVQNGSGPGHFIVCEKCHAPPPDSMKPSMGNLITIHLSRGLYCTNCHNSDNINPTHLSTRADNGTIQVIKCENCHADPQQFTSHVDGGKYCLNCHGNSTAAASITSTITPVQTMPITTYTVPTDTIKTTVKLDYFRGFVPVTQTIKTDYEVLWTNDGTDSVTLVSADGLFEPKYLNNGKRTSYIFKKPGTYSFYLNENKNAKGTIIVEGVENDVVSPVNTPVSTAPASPYTSSPVKQRAQLQVEISAGKTKQELTITVNLKNIGNATASHINLTIDNPPELEAVVLSGGDKIGETITWKGELKPNDEHIARYSVKAITGRNLEIPLKVTYAKLSPDEKAKALGILSASASTEQLLTPEDWEVISLIIKIAATVPGFEALLAVVSLILASVIWRNRK